MRASTVPDAEIRHRIDQALNMAECMTVAMLSAFLTSRVSISDRERVLTAMQKEGLLEIVDRSFVSLAGRASVAKVIQRKRV